MREAGFLAVWAVLCFCRGSLIAQERPAYSPVPSPKHSPARKIPLEPGSILNGTYRNNHFQFLYRLPFGWVDRTSDIREGTETDKSKVLLAIFERPPAATGDTVNSAVIIAAETVDSYPGLKTAVDYFGPLTELTESKGFKAVNEPYEFPVDGRPIIRRDFMKDVGSLAMHQSSLVMLAKGYVLSFTFIGGNDDEVVELIEKLSFVKKTR
jgi:hypothetical protein